MINAKAHIPNEELLLLSEGEISPRRAALVREHLDACGACRERLKNLQRAATDVFDAYHYELDPVLPSETAARSALHAKLREFSRGSEHSSWMARTRQTIDLKTWAYVCAMLVVTAIGLKALQREIGATREASQSQFASGPVVPDARLTPGAAAQFISTGEICSLESPAETTKIPSDVKKKVFHEYGMDGVSAQNYEVDHLITPALGGTDDIRNLWPEPYASTEWNAHVKDQLENRLHELVCEGKIDLPTAQHEIASNWISAYRKYFHTDRPLPITSLLIKPRDARLDARRSTFDRDPARRAS
jgi:Putative zinc-finger